jgi:GNAT superfamily N-acetyltransferase
MNIVDLTPPYQRTYLACLKDWDADQGLIEHKARWHERMVVNGLRVKLALDHAGRAAGMVQYLPIEHSRAEGENLLFIQCIWVHGYDEGPGNAQGHGYGRALLQAVEDDARALGKLGVAAWGMDFPQWFPVSWFEHFDYLRADLPGPEILVWKPFGEEAPAPRWLRMKKAPKPIPGKVTVTAFVHGWCPIGPANAGIAQAAVAGLAGVKLRIIDTSNRGTLLEWGIDQGIWIDDAPFRPYGPPFSVEDLRQAVKQRLDQLEASM